MKYLTYQEWCDALYHLRSIYPYWDKLDEKTKKLYANNHGYPYRTANDTPNAYRVKRIIAGTEAEALAKYKHWARNKAAEYATFEVLKVTGGVVPGELIFNWKFELEIIYRA